MLVFLLEANSYSEIRDNIIEYNSHGIVVNPAYDGEIIEGTGSEAIIEGGKWNKI